MPDRIARLILMLAAAAVLAAPAGASAAGVKPTVDCITPTNSAGVYAVYFGYTNPGAQTTINFGDDNSVYPGLGYQGQPTVFNVGVYPRVFRAVFNTNAFTAVTWVLNGQTASATLATPRCLAATTGAATAITTTGATITANLEPDELQVAYYFEYGTVGGALTSTLEQRVTPSTDLTVLEPLTGLQPGTTYRYKIVASGSITTVGEERTFTTPALPVVPPASADVSIEQAVAPASIAPGDASTVKATLANAGPDAAQGVDATLRLPVGAVVDRASMPPGCAPATDGVTITCAIGTLDAAASTSRAIPFRLAQAGAARIVGTVSSTTADPAQANNLALTDFTIPLPPSTPQSGTSDQPAPAAPVATPAAPADLLLTRTGPPRATRVGRTATLRYAVSNQGAAAAPGAVLVVRLPAGLSKRSVTGATCTGRQILRCPLGTLAPGAAKTVVVGVRVRSRGSHTDAASVASLAGESAVANNLVDGTVRGKR